MYLMQNIRQFFFAIDSTLFNFIPTVYDLLISISRTTILSQGQIKEFADRIQALLAVFMLFKVSFSLITYVLNPDEFSDKSKGFGSLWKNAIISLVLLVLVPYIFSMAYSLQSIILEDNTIANLIFGNPDNEVENSKILGTAGQQMAYTVMIPLFSPNYSHEALLPCMNMIDKDGKFNEECRNGLYSSVGGDPAHPIPKIEDYIVGVENSSVGMTFRSQIGTTKVKISTSENTEADESFLIDYKIPITTVVSVVVLLLLITFTMDIALRSVKLAFLQLIAPIPIISYIDPKSGGKDGLFKSWYKMCISTYLSLFIRLLALYFGVYIISKVGNMTDVINGSSVTNGWVQIFIIIGVLMFAKQLPKILEGLGVKLDGNTKFTLNPFKKIENDALGGKQIIGLGKRTLGAAGAVTAATVDKAARVATSPGAKNKLAALNPLGLVGAAGRGFIGGKGFFTGMKNQAKVNRRLRESRVKGLSPTAAYMDYFGSKFGLDNASLEKEGYYLQKSKDNATMAKRKLESDTLQKNLDVDNLKKQQTGRKNAQNAHSNLGKKASALLEHADDSVNKKVNFSSSSRDKAETDNLRRKAATARMQGLSKVRVGQNPDGSYIEQDIDEYELRQERRINSKYYNKIRNANSTNVDILKSHSGEELSQNMLIGDADKGVFLKQGTIITQEIIDEATKAQNIYLKESKKGALNDFNTLSFMADLKQRVDQAGPEGINSNIFTNEERTFYNNNIDFYSSNAQLVEKDYKGEFDKFSNLKSEFNVALDAAQKSVIAYNSEYGVNGSDDTILPITHNIKSNNYFELVDTINTDMKTGDNVSHMNNEETRLNTEIEKLEREIEELRRNAQTTYYDENGNERRISLDEYDKVIKLREERLNALKDKHKELANLHEYNQ